MRRGLRYGNSVAGNACPEGSCSAVVGYRTKAVIVQAVTQETGLTKCKSADAVESVLDIMRATLASGDRGRDDAVGVAVVTF